MNVPAGCWNSGFVSLAKLLENGRFRSRRTLFLPDGTAEFRLICSKVRKAGNCIGIIADLVSFDDGVSVWRDSYARDLRKGLEGHDRL